MQAKTFIIAEAGVNHNGSEEAAMRLVDAAVAAGADAIKFQTFRAGDLASAHALKANYQKRETGSGESQLQMLKELELSRDSHYRLCDYCEKLGIEFLSTPFDGESLDFLVSNMKLNRLKISSGDITNAPLLLAFSRSGCELILSTGMATLSEVEQALGVLAWGLNNPQNAIPQEGDFFQAWASREYRNKLKNKITLLHCTSQYPAPFGEVNLRVMATLQQAFSLPVGYSDHTSGISVATAAVALGAVVIEKHFTLDRSLPGPDHTASLEPAELKLMVTAIRQTEQALGSPIKSPQASELNTLQVARKSLVIKKTIRAGELFSEDNLTTKRPSSGRSPYDYWKILGTKSDKDYQIDEILL